ncbi:MAG TPA: phosphotransferase [Acidimicrobiales bacterium]|nr:phosphotransferase [Acidimicrobiales bacterium]
MNEEPLDLDRDALVSTLRAWGLSVTSLRYMPVGAGSHHYLAIDSHGRRWFVTVDWLLTKLFGMMGPTFVPWSEVDLDAGFGALDRAFRTTVALRDAGLEFVHAPIAKPDGEVLERLGDYAVSVFPFIDDISETQGDHARKHLLEALGRLHAATDAVPPGLPQRDSLTVPVKPLFLEALDDLRTPWDTGPYGEAARLLLLPRVDAVLEHFRRCDELADAVRAADKPWVVTHGQMHGGNIVRTRDGVLLLVDWDCAAVAPRERDLGTWENGLDPKDDEDWAAYTSAGQPRDIDPTAMELYRHIGLLWGVCADTAMFRSPHVDDGDSRHEWKNLQTALAQMAG